MRWWQLLWLCLGICLLYFARARAHGCCCLLYLCAMFCVCFYGPAKLLFKVLDAWSDRILRVENQKQQVVGLRSLVRRRSIQVSREDDDLELKILEDRWGVRRVIGGVFVGVPRFAGRTLKNTVKTGFSMARSLARD